MIRQLPPPNGPTSDLVPDTFILSVFCGTRPPNYLSPTGNDTNNGTSQSQRLWRTIDGACQLNSIFQPGDRILFQRGGETVGLIILRQRNATP
ncbi:MAG: hypothetical protein IPF41_15845 [Flavobacteriales bacterium]|nr:hypothetical protein [Flavobacteriales bacterium]